MCRASIKLGYLDIASRLLVMALTISCVPAHAQAIQDEDSQTWSYLAGTDFWRLNASKQKDSQPGYVEENSNLLLPNNHTKWNYSDASAWGRVVATQRLTNDITVSAKVRADQTLGMRVDEAQIEKYISPSLGVRAGVVDYKTSWCRAYEADNGWMQEIEAVCNTPQFRDVTGGAPGVQIFTNLTWDDHYRLQSQIGLYRPLFLNYAPKEFGNIIPSPNYQVQKNEKLGVNFNLINLHTGLEARLSYIHANQIAYLPESEILGTYKMLSDLIYLGLSVPVTEQTNFRITHLQQHQKATCRSETADIATCNFNSNFQKKSTAVEFSYRWENLHLFSIGLNRTNFDLQEIYFTPHLDVYQHPNPSYRKTNQTSFAWRKDWQKNLFTIVQFIKAEHQSSATIKTGSFPYQAQGNALGVRLGYSY
jgi:hypothetical protein